MPRRFQWTLGTLVLGFFFSPVALGETPKPVSLSLEEVAHTLEERGGNGAWERLLTLSDEYGHRMNGSVALEKALDWAQELMRKDGLSNVRKEEVWVPHWERGAESAEILAPAHHKLTLLGLGGSIGTGDSPVEAEVIVFSSLDAIKLSSREQVEGKIVLINQPMPPYNPDTGETHYGATVGIRVHGPSAAARLGARATLIRSVTANSLATPHTGMTRYAEDAPKIPAAAVTIEDAERIARLAKKGPVTVRLSMGSKWHPDARSGNVIGEIPGTEKPEEIIVLGAHMDSWDVGDSSNDDGCGCVMAMEAARLLLRLPVRPKRTIRVVLFTDEEHRQSGGKAYYEAHHGETHRAAVEADMGCGAPRALSVDGSKVELRFLQDKIKLFSTFGITHIQRGGSGADIAPLVQKDGVLGIGIAPDASTYFDRHHSAADTVEKLSPEHLRENALTMALLAYLLAEHPAP